MSQDFLGSLWNLSLWLAAASLLVTALLILFRLFGSYSDRHRDLIRKEIVRQLYAAMDGRKGDALRLATLIKHSRVAAQALLELSTLIRGEAFEAAVEALEALGFDKRMLRLTQSSNGAARLAAIDALGYVGGPEATRRLARIANLGTDVEDRIAAVRALQARGDAIDLDAIAGALALIGNRLPGEFEAVLDQLARTDPTGVESLLTRQGLPTIAYVQGLRSLGDSGNYGSLPIMKAMAASADPAIRAAAIGAMGLLGHPSARDEIRKGLSSDQSEVRSEAARAAGQVALKELEPYLVTLLGDTNWDVRINAARALAQFGDAGLAALQHAAAGDADSRSARTAQMLLAENGALA